MSRLLRSALREPLVHFLVIAALLFALDHAVSGGGKARIVVDRRTALHLIDQREDLLLRPLSAEERRQTVADYVDDEILYHEAYRRGLDRSDSRMRRELIGKMRALLSGDVEPPSEQRLREYFEAHRDAYVSPATVSVDVVSFPDPERVPGDLLPRLRAGLEWPPPGDPGTGLRRRMPRLAQRDLVGLFGPDAARALLAIEDDGWHGPIASTQGALFVRIRARTPEAAARYERVRPFLADDWAMAENRRTIEAGIDAVRDDYEVVIEDYGGASR